MVTGLKDYVNKVGFKGVVLGMSGGIDSALSAAVAVDALGADRVKLFMMPSPYTSKESLDDAKKAGEMLGCEVGNIPILPAMNAFDEMFCDIFKGQKKDITEENIQARIRGVSLMAYSNKFGYMVLSTGNKSENSVGYATLYGDMCGGFNAIKDVYKTSVFDVCKWRNENKPKNTLGKSSKVMPDNIITKPPTAELREDQKDEDSLPPYEVLDAILKLLIEKEMGVDEIIKKGYEIDTVKKVWWLLKTSEYKRRQSAPGVKITSCSFGKERRYPIVNKF
jgi:NAD+ synthase